MNDTLLHNTRGSFFVLREMLIALARANPEAASIGLLSCEMLSGQMLASKQPEAFLAGMDMELQSLKKAIGSPP